ncbi:MAG: division/cell wall cluster transcriptional repressor MraZ [Ferruginibacter sp.]
MIQFLGEYECTIDAKGRFLLPAAIKKQLPEADANQFVINRGFEKCLTLYPIQSWQPIFDQISKLNDFDPKVREFRRYFFNGATNVELDTAGRILLPKNLVEHASLQKDIVLVSALNKIEIWDKQKYQEFFDSYTSESFSSLANEVMNKPGNEKE